MNNQENKIEGQATVERSSRHWARQELVQSVNRAIKEVNYVNTVYGLFNIADKTTNYTRAELLLEDILENLSLVKELFKADTKKDIENNQEYAELPPKMAEVVQALSKNHLS